VAIRALDVATAAGRRGCDKGDEEMDMWNRLARVCGVLVLALAAARCGAAGQDGALTGPSMASSRPSAAPAATSTVAGTLGARAGAYDVTGIWRLVITDQRSGEVWEDVDNVLTQHADGSITFCGECEGEQFTLTPRGPASGAAIPYALSYFGEGEPCNATAAGAALLDTRRNTITAHGVQGVSDDCSRFLVSLRLTRES
jgi:hypothetical protein